MPMSSTNNRLTREIYKPPPKSLEQIQMEETMATGGSGSRDGSREGTPGSRITRERHLSRIAFKKTAVVGPVKDVNGGRTNGAFTAGNDYGVAKKGAFAAGNGASTLKTGGAAATGGKSALCCLCHGLFCSRCAILSFLLGLLLGALITGLVTGLVLGGQLDAAAVAAQATTAATPTGCLQSPCSSASATCAYTNNNTEIDCQCQPLVGDPVSSSGISVGGYRCTFYNITSTTALPMTAT